MTDGMRLTDFEYGQAPDEIIEWLASEGFLQAEDCAMNIACGRGGFAGPMSRVVRILVCMDKDPASLALAGERCAGGCKTELFEMDWNSYVPGEGYDVCLVSPSYLCYSGDALLKMEKASKRSCIAVFPEVFDFRRLRKALIQSAGRPANMQEFSDPRPFEIWLENSGRAYRERKFHAVVECPTEVLREGLIASCGDKGIEPELLDSLAERFADSISQDGMARYKFEACVLAWNKG